MPNNGRSTEQDIAVAVLKVLGTKPSGEASIQTLIEEVPKHHSLTAGDKMPSTTRSTEELWEQIVRNITSHKDSPSNFIARGYLVQIDGGLKITPAGQDHLASV